jgi:hypothetical protein
MLTSADEITHEVTAIGVHFVADRLLILLSDGREVSVPIGEIQWLDWLAKATPEQRAAWTIEPGGFAIYWEGLDDGIEISHLLGMQSLT